MQEGCLSTAPRLICPPWPILQGVREGWKLGSPVSPHVLSCQSEISDLPRSALRLRKRPWCELKRRFPPALPLPGVWTISPAPPVPPRTDVSHLPVQEPPPSKTPHHVAAVDEPCPSPLPTSSSSQARDWYESSAGFWPAGGTQPIPPRL